LKTKQGFLSFYESFNEDHDLTPFSSQKGTLELHGHLQPHWLVPPSARQFVAIPYYTPGCPPNYSG
jgi:hypothetical protein